MSGVEHGVEQRSEKNRDTARVQQEGRPIAPASASGMASLLLHLQRTVGNQAVNHMLRQMAPRPAESAEVSTVSTGGIDARRTPHATLSHPASTSAHLKQSAKRTSTQQMLVQRAMLKASEGAIHTYYHSKDPQRTECVYIGGNLFRTAANPARYFHFNEKLDQLEALEASKVPPDANTREPAIWWPAETAAVEATAVNAAATALEESKDQAKANDRGLATIRQSLGLTPAAASASAAAASAPAANQSKETRWKGLKVASTSIRNFEEGENEVATSSAPAATSSAPAANQSNESASRTRVGRTVFARRSFIGTVNVAIGEIFLSPLVGTHRNDNTDHPDDYAKGSAITAGEFVAPLHDTRNVPLQEKTRRRNARAASFHRGTVHAAARALHTGGQRLKLYQEAPNLLATSDPNAVDARIAAARHAPPPADFEGSAHNQLRALTSTEANEVLGFTLTKIGLRHAIFKDTSGTLNERHFGTIGIPRNWKQVIMEVLARDLGVELQEEGRALPGQELHAMPPETSGLRPPREPQSQVRPWIRPYGHANVLDPSQRRNPENLKEQPAKGMRIVMLGRIPPLYLVIVEVKPPIFDAKEEGGRFRQFFTADYGRTWTYAPNG